MLRARYYLQICDSDASLKMLHKAQRLCKNLITDSSVCLEITMKWFPTMIDVLIFRNAIAAAFEMCKKMDSYYMQMTKTHKDIVAFYN